MDRFKRPLFACGVGLVLAATGCRSTQPEVPPGRPFAKDGQQRQAIQFSSQGQAPQAQGSAPYMPNNLGNSDIASGIAVPGVKPNGAAYGGPEGTYGPPGSSGAPGSPAGLSDPGTVRASVSAPGSIPLTGTPPSGLPPMGEPGNPSPSPGTMPDLNVAPPRESAPLPNPILPSPIETPGQMGTPGAMPSPM